MFQTMSLHFRFEHPCVDVCVCILNTTVCSTQWHYVKDKEKYLHGLIKVERLDLRLQGHAFSLALVKCFHFHQQQLKM